MAERFVPLAAFVRAAPSPVASAAPPVSQPPASRGAVDYAQAGVVHELTLLTLAAREAFARAAARLLRELANDVLARELLLAPADVAALVGRAVAAFAEHAPVGIAVSGFDADRVRAPLPVRVDPRLGAGDLVVDVRDGAFESSFTFRLEDALERAECAR